MCVDRRHVDGGDDAPRSVAHGRPDRADAALEEGLADAVAPRAVLGEHAFQIGERGGGLRRHLGQLAFREERAQLLVRLVEQQHAPHDGGVGGKSRADLHAAGDRGQGGDAGDVDDLASVPHRQMRGKPRTVAQLLQRRLADLRQIERGEIGEAAIEETGPEAEGALVGGAKHIAGALEGDEKAKHRGARQTERRADIGRGERRPLPREQREHVEPVRERGNDVALARVGGRLLDGLLIHAVVRTPRLCG